MNVIKANQKTKTVILTISILFMLIVGFGGFRFIAKKAATIQHQSALLWLKTAIVEGLDSHYKDNGFYPKNLESIRIEFPGDNADPSMLNNFRYITTGQEFDLTMTYDVNGKIYTYKWTGEKGVIKQ